MNANRLELQRGDISGLTNLEILTLKNVDFQDTSGMDLDFDNLRNLTSLDIINSNIRVLDVYMQRMQNLLSIEIRGTDITHISELGLPRLMYLTVQENHNLESVDLTGLRNIVEVVISDNNNLSNVHLDEKEEYKELLTLKVFNNKNLLEILPDFSSLVNLLELDLHMNNFRNIYFFNIIR